MRKTTCILSILFALTACNPQENGTNPADAQKFLNGMEGPKVPTVQDTLLQTAREAEKQGNFVQAAQLYRQVLEKQPSNKEVALSLAEAYRRAEDYDNALSIYDGLLTQDPANINAKEGKGLALMGKGDFDTPARLFEDVLKTDPTRWKTLNGLGILFTTRNMQPEAQKYFQAALKYHAGSATILNNIGLSQAMAGQYDTAINTLDQAATQSNGAQKKRIDLNMALVFAVAGKLDEARAITERYYTGAALDNNLGLYAHLAKDDQLAKAYLNMALTESKTFYERAWDNLEELGTVASNTSATPEVTVKSEAPPKVKKKIKKKATEDKPAAPTETVMPAPEAENAVPSAGEAVAPTPAATEKPADLLPGFPR